MTISPGKLGPTAKSQGQPDGSVLMNGLTGGLGKPSLPGHTGVIYVVLDTVLAAPVRKGIVLGVFWRGSLPWEGISKGLSWFGSGCSWNWSQHGSSRLSQINWWRVTEKEVCRADKTCVCFQGWGTLWRVQANNWGYRRKPMEKLHRRTLNYCLELGVWHFCGRRQQTEWKGYWKQSEEQNYHKPLHYF